MIIAIVAAAGNVVAGEIYKWTDADGNVHYVDRPTGDPTEERVDVISNRTDNAAVRASVQARLDRQAEREEALNKAAEDQQSATAAQSEREQREKQCVSYRERLESYLQSRRLYRENESGERVYLDEDEVMTARAALQKKIQETCD
jgi:hypothetical protein